MLQNFLHAFNKTGHVYDYSNSEVYTLKYVLSVSDTLTEDHWILRAMDYLLWKIGVAMGIVFLFIIQSSAVSLTLKETQNALYEFGNHLNMARNGRTVFFISVMYATKCLLYIVVMIGVMLILSEILNDRILAVSFSAFFWFLQLYVFVW